MLLIFATRFDAVTEQTFAIAQFLLDRVRPHSVDTVTLFEALATEDRLVAALPRRFQVVAFYSHGDEHGHILTQQRMPCWQRDRPPNLEGTAVFAHACRAMRWLADQMSELRARLLVGYRIDLVTPPLGTNDFWTYYRDTHSFIPTQLLVGRATTAIRLEFYDLCTGYFHDLNRSNAGLIELIAVQQSRDDVEFIVGQSSIHSPPGD